MTLSIFSPDSLDELALRLLDLAGKIRGMAHMSRENDLSAFDLHANKLSEWLSNLESWAHDGSSKMEAEVFKLRGLRRLQGQRAVPRRSSTAKKPGRRKAKRR